MTTPTQYEMTPSAPSPSAPHAARPTALPAPAPRQLAHRRMVDCAAFRRDDGLWDVDARLTDLKPFPHDDLARGPRAPADPVHRMTLRLTVDASMTIVDAAAAMEDVPYPTCLAVPPRVGALAGMRLVGGWRDAVKARLPRLSACTHLVELIGPAATTLYQAMSHEAPRPDRPVTPMVAPTTPYFIGGCWSWRADGPAVAQFFPQFAQPAKPQPGPTNDPATLHSSLKDVTP